MKPITVGSLFAGIGGIDLGLERTGGFKTVWQVEIDSYARRVLERHWPDVRRWDDVRTFPPPTKAYCQCGRCFGFSVSCPWCKQTPFDEWRCDLICGGFPCQDISECGSGAGLDGERSGLWCEFARVLGVLRPRYALIENVPALLGRGLGRVLCDLASLGYDAEWSIVSACSMGAPHTRERVFIVSNAPCERQQRRWNQEQKETEDWWGERQSERRLGRHDWALETRPPIERMADGVPGRVDSLRCYGNAVVPQVAEWIGRRILEVEKLNARQRPSG